MMDLRWHADEARVFGRSFPSRSVLVARWGWTDKRVRVLLASPEWVDPFNPTTLVDLRGEPKGQARASRGPAEGQEGANGIRTKSACLTFSQFERDSMVSRPALVDYLLMFKAPGENAVPVIQDPALGGVSRDEWIQFADGVWQSDDVSDVALFDGLYRRGEPLPVWTGIKETDTLNTDAAKADEDERHVCPLQLPLIDRCIRLWSNRGETVLSPFMGVGSEGYKALELRRKFIGFELNDRYFGVAKKNLDRMLAERDAQLSLFGAR